MKTLLFFLISFMAQKMVLCNIDDRHVEDHSHEDDRLHINEWVVHIPKGE